MEPKIKLLILFCALLFPFAQNVHGVQSLPDDMHTMAQRTLDLVFREDFRAAEEEARKIVRAYPDHPAGYFFQAVVADAWMLRFQNPRREAEFHRFCDQAVERAERMLAQNPKDEWARFFLGAADGLRGTYEARYERWVTAFRHGWKGVSVFLRMASDNVRIADIDFGIGTYDYWRSALTRLLWFMPGVPDKRAEGITKLRNAMNNGLYSRTAAAMVLVDIFDNEGRHQDALNISDRKAQQYPRALVFQWGRARALHGLNRHDEAITAYQQILKRVEADPNTNHYNAVVSRMGMAKSMAALGRNQEALEQIEAMNAYTLSRDIRRRLESVFTEANTLRRRLGRS